MTRYLVFVENWTPTGPFVFGLVASSSLAAARKQAIAELQAEQWALSKKEYEAFADADGEVAVGVAEVIETVSLKPDKLARGEVE